MVTHFYNTLNRPVTPLGINLFLHLVYSSELKLLPDQFVGRPLSRCFRVPKFLSLSFVWVFSGQPGLYQILSFSLATSFWLFDCLSKSWKSLHASCSTYNYDKTNIFNPLSVDSSSSPSSCPSCTPSPSKFSCILHIHFIFFWICTPFGFTFQLLCNLTIVYNLSPSPSRFSFPHDSDWGQLSQSVLSRPNSVIRQTSVYSSSWRSACSHDKSRAH